MPAFTRFVNLCRQLYVHSVKTHPDSPHQPVLVRGILSKLSHPCLEQWVRTKSGYRSYHGVSLPEAREFKHLVDFLDEHVADQDKLREINPSIYKKDTAAAPRDQARGATSSARSREQTTRRRNAQRATTGQQQSYPFPINKRNKGKSKKSGTTMMAVDEVDSSGSGAAAGGKRNSRPKNMCCFCKGNHVSWNCRADRGTPEEMMKAAREADVCLRCLRPGHYSSSCTSSKPCGTDGCTSRHHPLLHGAK